MLNNQAGLMKIIRQMFENKATKLLTLLPFVINPLDSKLGKTDVPHFPFLLKPNHNFLIQHFSENNSSTDYKNLHVVTKYSRTKNDARQYFLITFKKKCTNNRNFCYERSNAKPFPLKIVHISF